MNYKQCAKELLSHDGILVLTHKNPDGDTAGSAAALCAALRRAGKKAYLFNNIQFVKKQLPYVEQYTAPDEFIPEYIVSVDISTETLFPKGFEGQVDLCIDHHGSNSHYAKLELVKPEKAACGEIILEIIKNIHESITPEEATLLYMAVSTDTGCFRYANTNASTFRAAAELLASGADNSKINMEFFRKVSKNRLALEGLIYSELRTFRDGKICAVIISQRMLEESGVTDDDMDDIANLSGRVEGTVLNITVREETDGTCKISMRSTEEVNSSDICAVFGGGGHKMAAGCRITGAPEKALEMLLNVIDEVWK